MKRILITLLFLFGIIALPAAKNAYATGGDESQSAGNDSNGGEGGTAADPTTGTTGQDDDDDTPDMIHPGDQGTEEAKASISTAPFINMDSQSFDGTSTGGSDQNPDGTGQTSGTGTTGDGGTLTPKT